MTGHIHNHIMTTMIGPDPSPLTTDAAKEDALTSQDHSTVPTMAEAQSTIGGTHPTPHPDTAAACTTHQPTDALGNTLTGTCHISTTVIHPRHTTFPTRFTLKAIPQTETNQF